MLNAKCALESHVPVLIQVETVAKGIFHDSRNPHAHLGPWKHYRLRLAKQDLWGLGAVIVCILK